MKWEVVHGISWYSVRYYFLRLRILDGRNLSVDKAKDVKGKTPLATNIFYAYGKVVVYGEPFAGE